MGGKGMKEGRKGGIEQRGEIKLVGNDETRRGGKGKEERA